MFFFVLVWGLVASPSCVSRLRTLPITRESHVQHQAALLAWVNRLGGAWELEPITSFAAGFGDGLAFNAVLAHYNDEVEREAVMTMSPAERLENAFDLVGIHLFGWCRFGGLGVDRARTV